jgi:lipoprotein-anchoring transpeptidase ErfK/SrfK
VAHPGRLAALLVAGSIALGACGAGSGDRPSLSSKAEPPGSTTSTTLPSYISLVATAAVPEVQVFNAPYSPAPARSLVNPWLLNDDPGLQVPLVFLVAERLDEWLKVNLPERPNGSVGWIRASDVTLTRNRYRIVVELAAHQITVYDGESVLLQEQVAVGKDATPTPPGVYFLRVLLKAPNPNTVYGPYAYGLSGHSDVLTSFNGGDGELGIHGNNDASVLGTSVSNGCIRMSNDGITRLTSILPLGTPVSIV